ncbi:hypothetical protein GCM10010215_05150 [Streptomyces virginiae]|uniref:Uncharacterized protein n=1 Tax=Streptomyces virginiae TaxID=1961 RepID=A0ABQ3NLN0_STRVG|nr:hypothetical protein GCM10010215_05150 [Streptomyces virginiae]GHI13688.1 hypothetical protein Scinn_31510 [Streptomyces virginiae]GLV93214.1 hypothetical protein Slala04_46680 [Streptomyces lavendulae subsp. lavendulae]
MSATRPSRRGGRCEAGLRAADATLARTASALANRLRRPAATMATESTLLRRLGTPLTSPFPCPVKGGA